MKKMKQSYILTNYYTGTSIITSHSYFSKRNYSHRTTLNTLLLDIFTTFTIVKKVYYDIIFRA